LKINDQTIKTFQALHLLTNFSIFLFSSFTKTTAEAARKIITQHLYRTLKSTTST